MTKFLLTLVNTCEIRGKLARRIPRADVEESFINNAGVADSAISTESDSTARLTEKESSHDNGHVLYTTQHCLEQVGQNSG
jgi:hypothetical protein